MVYARLDAVKLAQKHPDRQVILFAVGFETTAPANALAVWQVNDASSSGTPLYQCGCLGWTAA